MNRPAPGRGSAKLGRAASDRRGPGGAGRSGRRRRRGGGRGARAERARPGTWFKTALIALILYVAGVLVPLAAWVFAVQRRLLASAWSTGDVVLFALAVAAALAMGLTGWIKRLAQRV